MDYNYENFGKFIQRTNLSLILFCVFAVITSLQISTFNRNLEEAAGLKARIVMDQSLIFEHINNALVIGSGTMEWQDVNWQERLSQDDLEDLINHQLSLENLSGWFDAFVEKEKNEDAALELWSAQFSINNIHSDLDRVVEITGNEVNSIEGVIDALDSYLTKREIKSIKLPLLGTEIEVSLLKTVVPVVQITLLLILSVYLLLTSILITSSDNASQLLSQTITYVNKYDSNRLVFNLFRIPRLISSILMITVLWGYGLLNWHSWQFYATITAITIHATSFMLLDAKIFRLIQNDSTEH